MLEGLREASNKTVGTKQTLKAVQGGLALKVFLAEDVDDYISQKLGVSVKNTTLKLLWLILWRS